MRAARLSGAIDHLPKAGLDTVTLERAVRYAADHRRSVERLEHTAMHDALTGLPNRTLFLDRLEQSLRRARRRGAGSGARSSSSTSTASRSSTTRSATRSGTSCCARSRSGSTRAIRPGDTVARMGGDEFTVLLEDVADPREATVVAERVLATLSEPFPVAGRELHVSCSIGIALAAPDADPEELIRDADVAMYRAKAEGKARHAVFDARMHRRVLDRLNLETDLRRAIEREDLQVLYQPIFRTDTAALAGFEALCRWEVEPDEFVAVAEETGLIVPLGHFVLREAAKRAARGACPSR